MKRTLRRRLNALEALAKSSVPELERALRGGKPDLSPERAAEALSKSRKGRQLLIKIIKSQAPTRLRQAAIYGFVSGEIKLAEFNLLLCVFQSSSEEPGVRGQAAEVLGPRVRYDAQKSVLRRCDVLARSAFLRGLDDPAPEVRFWSIFALARPGNEWVIPKLETMTSDSALVPNMWTVGQEARWAINWIQGHPDFDPSSAVNGTGTN